jgi:hypothetical protein
MDSNSPWLRSEVSPRLGCSGGVHLKVIWDTPSCSTACAKRPALVVRTGRAAPAAWMGRAAPAAWMGRAAPAARTGQAAPAARTGQAAPATRTAHRQRERDEQHRQCEREEQHQQHERDEQHQQRGWYEQRGWYGFLFVTLQHLIRFCYGLTRAKWKRRKKATRPLNHAFSIF